MNDAEIIVSVVRCAMWRKVPVAQEVAETIAGLDKTIFELGSKTVRTQAQHDMVLRHMTRSRGTKEALERLRGQFESWRG